MTIFDSAIDIAERHTDSLAATVKSRDLLTLASLSARIVFATNTAPPVSITRSGMGALPGSSGSTVVFRIFTRKDICTGAVDANLAKTAVIVRIGGV